MLNENELGINQNSFKITGYNELQDSFLRQANQDLRTEINQLYIDIKMKKADEGKKRKKIYNHIETFLDMIIDPIPNKQYNQINDAFGRTYAKAFEVFAAALLGQMNHDIHYNVSGQSNDKGADIKVRDKKGKLVEVCQVKLGSSHFQGGNGNAIVLQLVGTCAYFGVKKGIIFSSESRNSLSKNTQEIIDTIAKSEVAIEIETIFIEDIKKKLKLDIVKKAFILHHFNSAMKKTSPAGVMYSIPCTCNHLGFRGKTTWSLRTKIYELRREVRDKNINSFIYNHLVCTFGHTIQWNNTHVQEEDLENLLMMD